MREYLNKGEFLHMIGSTKLSVINGKGGWFILDINRRAVGYFVDCEDECYCDTVEVIWF